LRFWLSSGVISSEMDSKDTNKRRLTGMKAAIFYLGCVLMLLTARVSWSGHGALESGRTALAAGEHLAARVLLREAVSWYLPGAIWRQEAAELLWGLHERQVQKGALKEAVGTLQALRAGFIAAQSIVRPDEEWIQRVNERLVPLLVQWESSAAKAEGREISAPELERTRWMRERLLADSRPNRLWAVVMVIGFSLWVGASISAARRRDRRLWHELAMAVCGLLVFCLGLGLA
jgi:hypothetical protein